MAGFNEDAFEAAIEIVAATMENTNISISAEGGMAVAEYFEAIYYRLADIAECDCDFECDCGFDCDCDDDEDDEEDD